MDTQAVAEIVARALAEDVGARDVTTTATVPEGARARALITQKAPGVVFGLEVAEQVFRSLDPTASFERLTEEGRWRDGGPVLRIEGSARAILTGERTALNFLQRLSGVATMAARCVARGRGHRRHDPRHAQDDPRPACAREGGRRGRWRHQPPRRPVRRDPDQGEPRDARGRGRRGGPTRARGGARAARSRSKPHARGGRRGAGRRSAADPARQHDACRAAGRGAAGRPAVPSSRPAAGSRSRRSGRSRAPAYNSSQWEPSPTVRPH